jgi:hypothetical protein
MPQLRTKLSERIANKRHQTKPNQFTDAIVYLTKLVDVIIIGLPAERLDKLQVGELQVAVSPAGREALEILFPKSVIHWCESFGPARPFFPEDWKSANVNPSSLLQDMTAMDLQHNLPIDLLGGRPVGELDTDQFAALIMAGIDDLGRRPAMWSSRENKFTMIGDQRKLN